MQTLEQLLVLLTLLGILGMLMEPLRTLHMGVQHEVTRHAKFETDMECSRKAERAHAYFLSISAGTCWEYPYTYLARPGVFSLTHEGEGHYD